MASFYESLRLYPPVTDLPKVSVSDEEVCGRFVPAMVVIVLVFLFLLLFLSASFSVTNYYLHTRRAKTRLQIWRSRIILPAKILWNGGEGNSANSFRFFQRTEVSTPFFLSPLIFLIVTFNFCDIFRSFLRSDSLFISRGCIGARIAVHQGVVILAHLLRSFNFFIKSKEKGKEALVGSNSPIWVCKPGEVEIIIERRTPRDKEGENEDVWRNEKKRVYNNTWFTSNLQENEFVK